MLHQVPYIVICVTRPSGLQVRKPRQLEYRSSRSTLLSLSIEPFSLPIATPIGVAQ